MRILQSDIAYAACGAVAFAVLLSINGCDPSPSSQPGFGTNITTNVTAAPLAEDPTTTETHHHQWDMWTDPVAAPPGWMQWQHCKTCNFCRYRMITQPTEAK